MASSRFLKALLAFLALPGVVAFVLPLLIAGAPARFAPAGLPALLPGCALLAWCVREFYTAGRGTLAPWSPPQALVTSGPYRYSRNPMYVAVLLTLAGWALSFRSWPLAAYAAAVAAAFQLRVVYGEEPWLAGRFGEDWLRYRDRVPRWFALDRRRETNRRSRAP